MRESKSIDLIMDRLILPVQFFLQVYFQFLYSYRHVVVRVMVARQIIFSLVLGDQTTLQLIKKIQQILRLIQVPQMKLRLSLALMESNRLKCPSMKNLKT